VSKVRLRSTISKYSPSPIRVSRIDRDLSVKNRNCTEMQGRGVKQDTGGLELYYELHGTPDREDLPWLVFSHSLACNSAMWAPQLDEFTRDFRILAFDTRGHGRSDAPAGPYTMDELAGDTWRLLKSLGIPSAHFIGLSMGGMIGQALALEHPECVSSLTLADTTSRWPPGAAAMFGQRAATALTSGMAPLVEGTLARWFTPEFHGSNPAAVARIGEMILTTPVAGYVACSEAIPRIDYTDRLREIRCPVLVIVGDRDPGTPVAMSQAIHDNAPGSQLEVIDHAAHLSNVEQPEAFNRTLRGFLDRVRSDA
jgi:3-oxoadipate enol-lactonase